jgi:hypothetical protein
MVLVFYDMFPLWTPIDHTGAKQHDHHRPEENRLQPGKIEHPPSHTQPEEADNDQQKAYFQFNGWIPVMVPETATHMANLPILFLTDGHGAPPFACIDFIVVHVYRWRFPLIRSPLMNETGNSLLLSYIIMIVGIYDNQEFLFVKRYFYDYDNALFYMAILSILGGEKMGWAELAQKRMTSYQWKE